MKKDFGLQDETLRVLSSATVYVASDIHFPYQDDKAIDAFLSAVEKGKPDIIVLNGDLLDFYKLSRFSKDPSGKNPEEEIEMCKNFLQRLRDTAGRNPRIYYTIGNHECFDKRTDVLTPDNGWVNIKDLVEYRVKSVMGYNISTGLIEETQVTNYHSSYCTELLNIETCNTKQIVTPNHELVLDKEIKIPAYLIDKDNLNKRIIPCADSVAHKHPKYNNNEIKLITWICTDGCIVFSKPRIQFKLSYPEKIQALKDLLEEAKIPYTIKKATMSGVNKLQPFLIRIYGEAAKKIIGKYFSSGKKEFPHNFKDLNKEQLRVLLNTIVQTDGAKKENRIYFYSSNIHNLDIIQENCVKNNLSCRIDEGRSGFNPFKKTYKAIITDNYTWVKNQNKIEVVPYRNLVYCLTTKLGTLVTRIDGKVAITGNSRLRKYILDNAPMVASLMDNVFRLLKLEDYDIVGCGSLTINDTFVFEHGTRLGNKSGLAAIKELETHYMSGATGHVHRLAKFSTLKSGKRFIWLETGCLCDLNPEYMLNADWEQGFGIVKFRDGKFFDAQVISIRDGEVIRYD